MKNKSLLILSYFAAGIFLSSMAMLKQLNMQDVDSPQKDNTVKTVKTAAPEYHQGMVTIKIRHDIAELNCMDGPVYTGIKSLDDKMDRYQVIQLNNRVSFRRDLMKEGMPDLSRLYLILFPDKYNVMQVARNFQNDPSIADAGKRSVKKRTCQI